MKYFLTQLLAAPFLLLGAVGVMAMHEPNGSASAYNGSVGGVYTAPIIGVTPGMPQSALGSSHLPHPAPSPRQPVLQQSTAPLAVHRAGFDVQGPPTVTPALINDVLRAYGSPMAGEGQQLYDLGVKYGIDPAYCLAFFVHESAAGTRGEAVLTHNLGNIRAVPGQPSRDGYRYFDTWLQGADAWYRLISSLYVHSWGLTTVRTIIPVYAPSADSNDPAAYIQDVEQMVADWRAHRS
jgi:hypothetical protein